jgi:hypothetical protein
VARPKKKQTDVVEEVKAMDFAGGKRVYFEDVKPARSQASEHMQTVSTSMKHVKKHLNMVPGGYQVALKIYEMEAGKREAFIRTVVGQLNELLGHEILSHHYVDLVDLAQQPKDDGYARPNLSVVADAPLADGDETDLMEAANAVIAAIDGPLPDGDPKDGSDGDDGSFEPSEAELAQQAGRKSRGKKIGEGFAQPFH